MRSVRKIVYNQKVECKLEGFYRGYVGKNFVCYPSFLTQEV